MSITHKQLMEKVNSIPTLPGIYKFLDSRGMIIYIGKSISLKNRVKSYFVNNHKWSKIEKLVSLIHDVEYEITDTHLEARLLECRLIKDIKPMFNSQFKNHERYVYLKIEDNIMSNPISLVDERKENSFGPFRGKHSLLKLIESLKNIYPISKVRDSFDFEYKLFPVEFNKEEFEKNRECLMDIFSDDSKLSIFIYEIDKKMKIASSQLQFGEAAIFRDMAVSLNYLRVGLSNYNSLFSKDIVLKIPIENGCKLFYISQGDILMSRRYPDYINNNVIEFISMGKNITEHSTLHNNEKEALDFRDILYSEIKSLAKDIVIIID